MAVSMESVNLLTRAERLSLLRDEPEPVWKRVDCDERCRLEPVIQPGMLERVYRPSHDPDAHYEAGLAAGSGVPSGFGAIYTVGAIHIDGLRHRIWVGDQEIHLPNLQFRLLTILAARPGQTVRHQELLRRVWGEEYVPETISGWGKSIEGHLLRVAMARLRERLGPARALVHTVIGVGYCLVAEDS